MGKVLPFRKKLEEADKVAKKLVRIADRIDNVILESLADDDIDPRDIAGLLSHRLGSLMRHMDEKAELWPVCERVLKRQAKIDQAD